MRAPYRPGSRVTVEANPKRGHRLTGWTLDGKRLKSRSARLAIGMSKARTLTPVFS
ncbi:hypothetical protein ACFQVC_32440 [Streptomyces monticola]|uniref:Bacterial repeat domain-containing protein n=1 Tax=Streptomyces monticola TaxID=2666263 RepID=A0ABW2JSF8_9ACTN